MSIYPALKNENFNIAEYYSYNHLRDIEIFKRILNGDKTRDLVKDYAISNNRIYQIRDRTIRALKNFIRIGQIEHPFTVEKYPHIFKSETGCSDSQKLEINYYKLDISEFASEKHFILKLMNLFLFAKQNDLSIVGLGFLVRNISELQSIVDAVVVK